MAFRATYCDVGASEREVCEIVIEFRRLPGGSCVALRAVVAVLAAFMIGIVRLSVILLVARPAIRRKLRVLSVGMASYATHFNVRARQRKVGIIMIK